MHHPVAVMKIARPTGSNDTVDNRLAEVALGRPWARQKVILLPPILRGGAGGRRRVERGIPADAPIDEARTSWNRDTDGVFGRHRRLKMDSRSHSMATPVYLREVLWRGDEIGNAVIDDFEPSSAIEQHVAPGAGAFATGFCNPYMCT